MKDNMHSLASTSAGQPPLRKICSMVPRLGVMLTQRGHKPSLFEGSQCLVRVSTLALPERYLACKAAFDTSYDEPAQVEKIGWGLERDM